MVIRLCEKIDRICFSQIPETGDDLRRVCFELVDRDTGYRKTNFDLRVLLNEFQQQCVGRKVAPCGYTLNDITVQVVVKISLVRTDIKEPQCAKSFWLMYLEIEDQIFFVCCA